MSLYVIDQICFMLQYLTTVNTEMLPERVLVEISLVLGESIKVLEELPTLITANCIGMGVVCPHHMMFQGGVRSEISPTLLADKFLTRYPLYDLAVQGILLLLEVLGTEVDRPASRVFPDHLLTKRTLVLLQLGVLIVQVFLQSLSRRKSLRAVITRVLCLLIK